MIGRIAQLSSASDERRLTPSVFPSCSRASELPRRPDRPVFPKHQSNFQRLSGLSVWSGLDLSRLI